jgi:hypothetical protein
MWCVAKLDEQYIARMEDVLGLYERPLSGSEPSGLYRREASGVPPFPCGLDESPGATTNTSDCATANVFCGVEPKAGRHFTKVTPTRCSAEFADYLLKIAARYPAADTIHLSWTSSLRIRTRPSWSGSETAQEPGYGTDLRSTPRPNMEAG